MVIPSISSSLRRSLRAGQLVLPDGIRPSLDEFNPSHNPARAVRVPPSRSGMDRWRSISEWLPVPPSRHGCGRAPAAHRAPVPGPSSPLCPAKRHVHGNGGGSRVRCWPTGPRQQNQDAAAGQAAISARAGWSGHVGDVVNDQQPGARAKGF